jgi:hypothetical protein
LYLLGSTSGLSVLENQNEAETGGRHWKKEIGRSRRAQPEEAGKLLHGRPAELKRSYLIYINNSFNRAKKIIK